MNHRSCRNLALYGTEYVAWAPAARHLRTPFPSKFRTITPLTLKRASVISRPSFFAYRGDVSSSFRTTYHRVCALFESGTSTAVIFFRS